MTKKTENLICPVCRSENPIFFEKFNTNTLYRCKDCDIVFSDTMKGMSREEYSSFYGGRGLHKYLASTLSIGQKLFLSRHNKLIREEEDLLDVGTSSGLFVAACCREGINVLGIDTDKEAINLGRKLFPEATLLEKNLGEMINEGRKFDYVTAFEVLEHVEAPQEFIDQCRCLLKPNGKLIFFVPNRNRTPILYKEMVDRGDDKPPHHLTKWSKKSLTVAFEKAGLQKIFLQDIGKYRFSSLHSFGFATSIRNKVIAGGESSRTKTAESVYNHSYRKLFSFLSDSKTILDKILFFWKDIALKSQGYEKDGLYAECVVKTE